MVFSHEYYFFVAKQQFPIITKDLFPADYPLWLIKKISVNT